MEQRKRVIVGVTGATGVEMSYELLLALRKAGCEIHLIVSSSAQMTWDYESRIPLQRMYDLADFVYQEDELDAVISSGSFVTDGMILMPCSMKTLAGIVAGYAETLTLRAADVCLKEGRKVVLVPREMPLGKIHLRNLKDAADCGCADNALAPRRRAPHAVSPGGFAASDVEQRARGLRGAPQGGADNI